MVNNANSAKAQFKPGTYKHYKGGEYQVLDVVIHSETEERLVLYRPLYGEQRLWVRPYDMFFQQVVCDNQKVDRFTLVKPID